MSAVMRWDMRRWERCECCDEVGYEEVGRV